MFDCRYETELPIFAKCFELRVWRLHLRLPRIKAAWNCEIATTTLPAPTLSLEYPPERHPAPRHANTRYMMVSRRFFFVLALIPLACPRELTQSHGQRRRAQDNVLHAGIGDVRDICDPLASECISNDMKIKEEIAAVVGSKSHLTGESYASSRRNQGHTTRVMEHHRLPYSASCLAGSLPCLGLFFSSLCASSHSVVHSYFFVGKRSVACLFAFPASGLSFFFSACDSPPAPACLRIWMSA